LFGRWTFTPWQPLKSEAKNMSPKTALLSAIFFIGATLISATRSFPAQPAADSEANQAWNKIAPFFKPPQEFADKFGDYRSPLTFNDGHQAKSAADWQKRRAEILATWHSLMGAWPDVLTAQKLQFLDKTERENFVQHTVQFNMTPKHSMRGYLLVPKASGPHPGIVVVYYEPQTAIGLNNEKEHRDFALQLAKRGFVCLSMGTGASIYYPTKEHAELQPLSANAYAAANAYHLLANQAEVDPKRIGIVGHSYGGKWAMFASCLYDKFACAAWSDGGVVFDETRPNVNYWEPWYLGYEAGNTRERGVPSASNPRTGAYKQMIDEGRDLHELHALMAPRPFLVSGGSEDQPERWKALNHAVAVNRLLGYENRVAMTNRNGHSPTADSNDQLFAFFEYFLKPGNPE
jgi:dienelactone hydrolase